MAEDDWHENSHEDVMTVGADLGNGFRPYIRHKSDCTLETGVVRPQGDGEPLGYADALVRLEGEEGGDTFRVETLYERPRNDTKGPAKVTTQAYRSGWDRIFGKPIGKA